MSRHGGSIRSAIGSLLHSSILFRPHQQPRELMPLARLMVEAPGYCPPGPKCLFHATIYRHSRLPGTPEIGIFNVNLKDRPDMASNASQPLGERKRMKRLVFALASTAILGVAGCSSSNQDQVNNAEMNQPSDGRAQPGGERCRQRCRERRGGGARPAAAAAREPTDRQCRQPERRPGAKRQRHVSRARWTTSQSPPRP